MYGTIESLSFGLTTLFFNNCFFISRNSDLICWKMDGLTILHLFDFGFLIKASNHDVPGDLLRRLQATIIQKEMGNGSDS
jgi:hypothetical protein